MKGEFFFLGIDAGGTHCRARLVDAKGKVLGSGRSGPANLTIGIATAYRSIMAASTAAFAAAKLGRSAMRRTHAGLGIAGMGASHRRSPELDRKSTRLNSSHLGISYAVFCLKKKKKYIHHIALETA